MYDIFIYGGMIVDGSGKKAFPSNIGIEGEKITYIGSEMRDAKQMLDAKGRLVTPGFIDAHSHGDLNFGLEYEGLAKISQGITSECAGNCGLSAYPISSKYAEVNLKAMDSLVIQDIDKTNVSRFVNATEFIKYTNEKNLSINTIMAIGHNTIRMAVMGLEKREATKEELEEMKAYVREAMEHGAIGLSSGLIYVPGIYTNTEEVVELCKVVKEYDGMYITHMRNEADTIEEALQEAISVAEQSGVRLWISHHKTCGAKNYGKTRKTVALMEAAKERGIDIGYDLYPYTSTGERRGYALLAPRYMDQGLEALIEKMKDPAFRQEAKADVLNPKEPFENQYDYCGGFGGIVPIYCPATPEAEDFSIEEYARNLGYTDPFDAYFDIMVKNKGNVQFCYFMMSYDDIDYLIQNDLATIGTDGVIGLPGHPLHPRVFGTFTFAIKQFVKDKKYFTMEEFIYKITKYTADKFGLEKRGELKEGYYADIVVMNPETIEAKAGYLNSHDLSEGIDKVIINGKLAYKNKQLTGEHAGKLLMK